MRRVFPKYALVPVVASLIFLTVLLSRPIEEASRDHTTPSPLGNEPNRIADAQLLRLSGAGQLVEAEALGRSRLLEGASSCLAATVTVHAAERIGRLPQLIAELEARRDEKPEPDEMVVILAAALAARANRSGRRALNLLSHAIHRGVPCDDAYLAFIELSQNQGRLREAEAVLSRLAQERPSDPFVLVAFAHVLDLRGDGVRALAGYQKVILAAPAWALGYRYYAQLLINQGLFEQAHAVSRAGVRVARQSQEPVSLARLLTAEGISLDRLERENESRKAFEEALAVARDHRLVALESRILLELSLLSGARANTDAAIAYLDRARELEKPWHSYRHRIVYLNRLGAALQSLGMRSEATEAFEQSVELAQFYDEPVLEMDARLHRASLTLDTDITAAWTSFQSIYERTVALDDKRGQARALSGLGATYERMGSYRSSLDYYRRALELMERIGDRHPQAIALGNIGLLYFRLGVPSRALVYSVKATQLARGLKDLRLQTSLQNGLAASLAGLGRLEESKEVYQRALDLASRVSPALEASALAGWSRVTLALGETSEAQEGFKRAFALATEANSSLTSVQALFGLGQCQARQAKPEQASATLQQALRIIESFRTDIPSLPHRLSYLETRAQVYSSLASVLIDRDRLQPGNGYREAAFEVVERSRARALLDAIASPAGEDGRFAPARQALSPRRVGASWIRSRVLDEGELLLEYTLGETRSFLWAMTREEFRVIELPARREIETQGRAFLQTVRVPPRGPVNSVDRHLEPARVLFETLLGPVDDLIRTKTHAIIVPDGILHHVPFEALAEPANPTSRRSGDVPRYVVHMLTTSYVPSASVLAHLRQRPARPAPKYEFLGFAQPNAFEASERDRSPFHRVDLPPIPHAALEVETVASFFPDSARVLRIGPDATELAVKSADLSDFRVIHFAAHAVADEVFPEQSAILLSPGSTSEDGVLRMKEVLGLRLASDLVVLSGCQTGVGQLLRAEGTLGFTWAFLSAGTSAIVVSLWNVNDRSTAEFMESFYRHMSRGLSPEAALREAKQTMLVHERKAFRHPYYWAPFVTVGEAGGAD